MMNTKSNRLHDLHSGRTSEEASSVQSGEVVPSWWSQDFPLWTWCKVHEEFRSSFRHQWAVWCSGPSMVRRDVVSSPRNTCHVQTSVRDDSISDPADLDLEDGYDEPDLCFSRFLSGWILSSPIQCGMSKRQSMVYEKHHANGSKNETKSFEI